MNKTVYTNGSLIWSCALAILLTTSCDQSETGVDTTIYEGSQVSENTAYRNPVWEPDLDGGAVFQITGGYVAIGGQSEWVTDKMLYCPVMTSPDLMRWNYNGLEAFSAMPDTVGTGSDQVVYKLPDWGEGDIHSVTVGFAKTVPSTSYWLFYQLGDEQAIGVAYAKSGAGPYMDAGKLLDAEMLGVTQVSDPFFAVIGVSTYLYYTTEKGTYAQRLRLSKAKMPSLMGNPELVANAKFKNVSLTRVGTKDHYLFGTVTDNGTSSICYAKSTTPIGPFQDIDGKSIIDASNGTCLVTTGAEMINPDNCSGFFTDVDNQSFILYNATDTSMPQLLSGKNRRPLIMTPVVMNEDGWFVDKVAPNKGWATPRFRVK